MTTVTDVEKPWAATNAEQTEKAESALRRGRDVSRDALVECGGYCYQILLAWVADDGVSYGLRKKLADRLSEEAGYRVDVHRLVRDNRIATLLSEGRPLGRLGIHAMRLFYPCIRRARTAPGYGTRKENRTTRPQVKGEEYELVPSVREKALALFAEACREGWQAHIVKQEVAALFGGKLPTPDDRRGPQEPDGCHPGASDWRELARRASPKDLAGLVVNLVSASADPAAAWREIQQAAGALKTRWEVGL